MTYIQKTLIVLAILLVGQQARAQKEVDYRALNNAEQRLIEFKDDDKMLDIKLQHLQTINKSRNKYKAQLVAFDILASRMANKMAQEAIDGKFMGHFNLLGQWPWYRYALAGGLDHMSENAAAISGDQPMTDSREAKLKYMQELHAAFMAEKKPNDGHKQNCIDKRHNYVGIGFALQGSQVRYYEIFIDRYLDIKTPKEQVKPGEKWQLSLKPLDDTQHVWMCVVTYEPFPSPMSAKKASSIPSYDDFGRKDIESLAPWELPQPDHDGYINFEFSFKDKGIYYIQVYVSNKPYIQGAASTEGKTCATGVVVTVQ